MSQCELTPCLVFSPPLYANLCLLSPYRPRRGIVSFCPRLEPLTILSWPPARSQWPLLQGREWRSKTWQPSSGDREAEKDGSYW